MSNNGVSRSEQSDLYIIKPAQQLDKDTEPEENDCPICLCGLKEESYRALPCHPKHCFHDHCLSGWVKLGDAITPCPVCKKKFVRNGPGLSLVLATYENQLLSTLYYSTAFTERQKEDIRNAIQSNHGNVITELQSSPLEPIRALDQISKFLQSQHNNYKQWAAQQMETQPLPAEPSREDHDEFIAYLNQDSEEEEDLEEEI